MAKVTSKLQVTIPKRFAEQFRIRPGDEIEWIPAGDSLRVIPGTKALPKTTLEDRLASFDHATERQRARGQGAASGPLTGGRGWTRDELYGRGRAG